jgi:Tfp pilus assembly protein PilF
MDPQTAAIAQKEFDRAKQELEQGNILTALASLEKALSIWDDPYWYSRLGFCVAKERGHLTQAFKLCQTSIEHDPDNPLHLLFLGKVHLVAGDTFQALQTFRQGMALGGSPEIERMLMKLGTRKSPVIPFLSRNNLLNKYLGKILGRMGMR